MSLPIDSNAVIPTAYTTLYSDSGQQLAETATP